MIFVMCVLLPIWISIIHFFKSYFSIIIFRVCARPSRLHHLNIDNVLFFFQKLSLHVFGMESTWLQIESILHVYLFLFIIQKIKQTIIRKYETNPNNK